MIQNIGALTMNLLATDRYSAIRQAFLFWSNLAREELKQQQYGRSLNMISGCLQSLLQIILAGLQITELDVEADQQIEEDENDQKWTVMRAASTMLGEVSPLVGDSIFKQVLEFATDRLRQEDWLNQYIGMCAIGSALNGPSSSLIY